jgi:hypothetical protein
MQPDHLSAGDEELELELLEESPEILIQPKSTQWGRRAVIGLACAAVLMASATCAFHGTDFSREGVSGLQGSGQASCTLLWQLSISEMVSQGWGSRMIFYATMYQRFTQFEPKCDFKTRSDVVQVWQSHGITPLGGVILEDEWNAVMQWPKFELDPYFRAVVAGFWGGPDLTEWIMQEGTFLEMFQNFAGCWSGFDESMLTMFKPLMDRFTPPIAGQYIGVHIRHGDKGGEGALISTNQVMDYIVGRSDWTGLTQVQIATDDANVFTELSPYIGRLQFNSNTMDRRAGGEASSKHSFAVDSVLQDTLSLARADVLVGSFASNFFRVAWILNHLRRTSLDASTNWCFDIFSNADCSDRKSFVKYYVKYSKSDSGAAKFVPSDQVGLADCSVPGKPAEVEMLAR